VFDNDIDMNFLVLGDCWTAPRRSQCLTNRAPGGYLGMRVSLGQMPQVRQKFRSFWNHLNLQVFL